MCIQVHPGNAFKCKECAGQTKSPETAEEKLDWSISERISALSSSSYSPLLFACFRKDSANISDNSWRSGMSWIFVWHKSLAFLKRVTINKVGFFQCPRGGSLYTHIHQVYTRLALPFLLQPHSHNEDIKHERIQAAESENLMWQWDLLHLNYSKVCEQRWMRKRAREGARDCKSEVAERMKNEGRGDKKKGAIFLSQFVEWKTFCCDPW